jgi:hypothetical protein
MLNGEKKKKNFMEQKRYLSDTKIAFNMKVSLKKLKGPN